MKNAWQKAPVRLEICGTFLRWKNKGVALCYKKFLLPIRLTNQNGTKVMITDADITSWLPGDNLYDDAIFIPSYRPAGEYQIQISIIDPQPHQPKVKLEIEGRDTEGWYTLGILTVNKHH